MNNEITIARWPRWIVLALLAMALILLLDGAGRFGGLGEGLLSAQEGGFAVASVAYFYDDDAQTGEQFADLAALDGYEMELIAMADLSAVSTYLPVIAGGTGTEEVGSPSRLRLSTINLDDYDIYIVGDDTDGQWDGQQQTIQRITDSGRPVITIGRGGHDFLREAGLPAGEASLESTAQVIQAESGAWPFFAEPHEIAQDEDDSVQVLDQAGDVAVIDVEAGPEVSLIGAVTGGRPFSLVRFAEQFLFWGFVDGPGSMTQSGQELFLNALWSYAEELSIPIAGAGNVPPAGVDPALLTALQGGEAQYGLLQLYAIPDEVERAALEAAGITLLKYLAGGYYHALFAPSFDPYEPDIVGLIRWAGLLQETWKIDPQLSGESLQRLRDNGIETVLVIFQANVSESTARQILAGISEEFRYFAGQTFEMPYDEEAVAALAALPEVRWIGAGPVPPQDLNDGARGALGTGMVHNPVTPLPANGPLTYLGLTGQGVRIAEFENEPETSHPDFAGRIILGSTATGTPWPHSTHVAGILIGSGADSSNHGGSNREWRGHAPGATLVSEGYAYDLGTEGGMNWADGTSPADKFSDAINEHDAEVANHSYVMAYGPYDASAEAIDLIVRGDADDSDGDPIPARTVVWAVANNGSEAQYDNDEGFYSIYAPAKNPIAIGSVDSNDDGYSMSGSKGPTFDGRLKPDVMAPGCQIGGDGGITSTDNGGDYDVKCGTSMAAPAATGVVALMLEQFHLTYGPSFNPRPATMKAILVNTAVDLVHTASDSSDSNDLDLCRDKGPGGVPIFPGSDLHPECWTRYGPGPDFATGYGLIDAVAAVNAVRGKMYHQDALSPADTEDEFTIEIKADRPELRVTMAYDDEPGDASLGNTAEQLVNDLDLRLIGPDGTHYPFRLNPLPANPLMGNGDLDPIEQSDLVDASTGDNDRDNVEQVLVVDPEPGMWTIQVTIEGGFPTGETQPYTIAGDFRSFEIIEPTTANPADGGAKDNPAKFLVVLSAEQDHVTNAPDSESTLADAAAPDFTVRIDGTDAEIISGAPVGDQFWLMVRGQSGLYDPGTYDLQVIWEGYGSSSQSNAVEFGEHRVADRVIVLDHSGSMADYDKMTAAKNAGRLFVDQALEDDRVAVVGFSTTASSPYPIEVVSAGDNPPELTDAKSAINGLNPTNRTAIGEGLLQGKDEIDTPGGSSELRRMILLSDGMENEEPFYDSAAVKDVIQPTDIVVDTVAVGPEEAGHHALLEQIAADNGGRDYHVTETGFGGTLAQPAEVQASSTEWLLPDTLANRLADQYKDIAEDIRREQRMWQRSGVMNEGTDREGFEVYVDKDLPSMTFAINWDTPQSEYVVELRSPSNRLYLPGDADVVYRSDPTHQTWIIDEPEGGVWNIFLVSLKSQSEYVAWLTAPTHVDLQMFVATPPAARVAGDPIQILGVLYNENVIENASVIARIYGPHSSTDELNLVLYDDGEHGDGAKGDGLYGNWYTKGELPGNYALRGRAEGMSPTGEPFVRYDNATFFLRPRALYVHRGDRDTAEQYDDLLENVSWSVDIHEVDDVADLDLGSYQLVVLGPDTGMTDEWGTQPALEAIVRNELPVLGLGEGGYAFFGELGLRIGWPNGVHAGGQAIIPHNTAVSIWEYPYEMKSLIDPPLELYTQDADLVKIFLEGKEPAGVEVFGWDVDDENYANVVADGRLFMLWGYGPGPERMTTAGRQLLANAAAYTAFGPRP